MFNKVKNEFYDNQDKIRELLEDIGCLKIKLVKDNFKFALDDEGSFSGNGNSLNIHTLKYVSYSHNYKGDIISLVSHKLNIELGDSLRYLCKFLNIDWEYSNNTKEVILPFNAFFLEFEKIREDTFNYKTYDESMVRFYEECGLSLYWIKDDISALTQEHFRIGYDPYSGRITIPWFDEIGRCIGFQGRLDRAEVEDWECKYLPVIPFSKGNALYGLYQAYKHIQDKGEVFIVESEKSVLKAYEMGIYNVVAIGCHSLSPRQIKIIKSLAVDVIICYDSDVPLQECIDEAMLCKIDNIFFQNSVMVLDMKGLGEKVCVFDLESDITIEALDNRRIYLE